MCFLRFGKRLFFRSQVLGLAESARLLNFAHAAFEHTHLSCKMAISKGPGPTGKRSATGQAICEEFRQYAFTRFREKASHTVLSWGLKASEDVGAIVVRLTHLRFFQFSGPAEENGEDYRGVYVIGDESWDYLHAITRLKGQCKKCSYDMRGSPTRVCPECGNLN